MLTDGVDEQAFVARMVAQDTPGAIVVTGSKQCVFFLGGRLRTLLTFRPPQRNHAASWQPSLFVPASPRLSRRFLLELCS